MQVWFLGFNMCALPGIIFSAWLLTRNGTWHTLRWHPDALTARRSAPLHSAHTCRTHPPLLSRYADFLTTPRNVVDDDVRAQ